MSLNIFSARKEIDFEDLEQDVSVFFETTKHHLHKNFANKSFTNFGTDSPRRYNSKSKYKKEEVFYNFNSDGYRCDELTQSDVLFLGCSYTQGLGLPLEETWSFLVHQKLFKNSPFINLAFQGGNFSYFQRTLNKTLKTVNPKHVVMLWPLQWRFELKEKEKIHVWTASGVSGNLYEGPVKERLLAYEIFRTREQELFDIQTNIYSINNTVESHGAKLTHSCWSYHGDETYPETLPGNFIKTSSLNQISRWKNLETLARDSTHPGAGHNENFAKEMICGLNLIMT